METLQDFNLGDIYQLVKDQIPHDLQMDIIRIQASKNLDWPDACRKAAILLDANSKKFEQELKRRAELTYKSRFMTEINKAKKTLREEITKKVRQTEDNFRVPCHKKCGYYMNFSNRDDNWESGIKPTLYEAFKTWSHTNCPK